MGFMNDLRTPIGAFFSLVGGILLVTAFDGGAQAPLSSANVNLYCGAAVLVFGSVMLWLALRTR